MDDGAASFVGLVVNGDGCQATTDLPLLEHVNAHFRSEMLPQEMRCRGSADSSANNSLKHKYTMTAMRDFGNMPNILSAIYYLGYGIYKKEVSTTYDVHYRICLVRNHLALCYRS